MKIKLAAPAVLTCLGLLAASAPANAAPAFVSHRLTMHAGPDAYYPDIINIPRGATVNINGCVSGWGWCDVEYRGLRGWVAGTYLQANYRRRREAIVNIGPALGLSIIDFDIGNYWDDYYRNRPFYVEREHYYRTYHPHWSARDRVDDHNNHWRWNDHNREHNWRDSDRWNH